MSSRRVQQLAVFNNSANSQRAESIWLHATVCSSHCVRITAIRNNSEPQIATSTWPPPLKPLTRYVSDESQEQNSATPNLPSRRCKFLARYLSDETQHIKSASTVKEQNDFAHVPANNTCMENIAHVVCVPQENQHLSKENIVGSIISSERIDMFLNEAKILKSPDERLNEPPHCAATGNQELISFLTLFEQQMEMLSNNPSEPFPLNLPVVDCIAPLDTFSCVMTKAQIEAYAAKRTSIIADGVEVPTASDASTTHNSKPSNVSLPMRPLNAYNYFFADERERTISEKDNDVYENDKKQRLLMQHLMKDRSTRRKHRKTHGKTNFTTLSRMISQRWNSLPEDKKEFYKEISAADWARCRRKMSERAE